MKPRLLDLFCCAGGAGTGYARAGFDVVGVDIDPQPRYPYEFHQADALEYAAEHWREFDAIHASPPCQAYSATRHAHANEYPELVEPTRELLSSTGKPWVMENVEGAPLVDPLVLCGFEFGLRAPDTDGVPLALKRHRLFESNVWLIGAGGCSHSRYGTQIAGVYTGSYHRTPEHRDNPGRRGGYVPNISIRSKLMGIDWMNDHELAQAIPPVYTEFIGGQLLAAIREEAA